MVACAIEPVISSLYKMCIRDRTQTVYTDAGSKIDVLLALNVPQSRTLAVVQRNREPAVGVQMCIRDSIRSG